MKKRINTLVLLSSVMIYLLCLPILANANAVPWSTEQYTATTQVFNSQSGTSLPLTSTWSYGQSNASSNITSSSMSVSAISGDYNYLVSASASFSGTYIAPVVNPLFQFTYDGYYTSVNVGNFSTHVAWLRVNDLTSNTVLYDNASLILNNNVNQIDIPTTAGHQISVYFGDRVRAENDGGWAQIETVHLNYSTAVAPEPISSILFVTGGTLLAGRRFIRRKA